MWSVVRLSWCLGIYVIASIILIAVVLVAVVLSISVVSTHFHLPFKELFVYSNNYVDEFIEVVRSFYPCEFILDIIAEAFVITGK